MYNLYQKLRFKSFLNLKVSVPIVDVLPVEVYLLWMYFLWRCTYSRVNWNKNERIINMLWPLTTFFSQNTYNIIFVHQFFMIKNLIFFVKTKIGESLIFVYVFSYPIIPANFYLRINFVTFFISNHFGLFLFKNKQKKYLSWSKYNRLLLWWEPGINFLITLDFLVQCTYYM